MTDQSADICQRTWRRKFADAFRGVWLGMRGDRSFAVHHAAAVTVLVTAGACRLPAWQWIALLICITMVMTAEMFNSALEHLARAVDVNVNPQLGAALDIASAAVLLSAVGAVSVAAVIFLPQLFDLLVSK